MRNIKLTIAYDGTNYHGFQVQARTKEPTIQGVLEEELSRLTGSLIKITGAGRTDAGVHARGQVVNYHTPDNIPLERYVRAVNSVLPEDIVCLAAEKVPEDFSARFSARGKIYSYTIYNHSVPPVFERLYSYYVPYALDVGAMQKAAGYLVGEHDFNAFKSSGTNVRSTVRKLTRLEISAKAPLIKILCQADGFLYNMVRIITGTLLEVGRGKLAPEDMLCILAGRDREQAGPTAPPQGLCLERVIY